MHGDSGWRETARCHTMGFMGRLGFIDHISGCSRATRCCAAVVSVWLVVSQPVPASDDAADRDALYRVTFTDANKQQRMVNGRILIEARDGGILLEGRDGVLWNVTPQQLKHRDKLDGKFQPFTAKELAGRLKQEFGDGFSVTTTRHYVLCSNAGRFYTQWCGALFERLSAAFYRQWRSPRLRLQRPAGPLVAVIFADRKQYARYAARDAGAAVAKTPGYFSARTNRVVLYDLTAGRNTKPARSIAAVRRKVRRSPFNVATVVHEATHQISFNSGLQTRYADNPLWASEGLAMYFETPDLRSPKGWRTVGKVNPFRIRRFRNYVQNRRKAESLTTLLADGKRFADSKTAADAYAEAWALTYFLIKTRRKDYEQYLARLSEKRPLIFGSGKDRVSEFRQVFGDPVKLEREFLKYFANRRLR